MNDTLRLLEALISRPSVTPADGGCQDQCGAGDGAYSLKLVGVEPGHRESCGAKGAGILARAMRLAVAAGFDHLIGRYPLSA